MNRTNIGVVCVLTLTVPALAQAAAPSPDAQRPKLTSLPPGIEKTFAVFGRPATQADAPPAWVTNALAQGPPAWLGVNPALARRVGSVTLIPGTDSMCLVGPATTDTLGTTGAAVSCKDSMSGAVAGMSTVTNTRVMGAVPNGVRSINLALTRGTLTVPVHRNVFVARAKDAKAVRFVLRGVRHTIRLPRPSM